MWLEKMKRFKKISPTERLRETLSTIDVMIVNANKSGAKDSILVAITPAINYHEHEREYDFQ